MYIAHLHFRQRCKLSHVVHITIIILLEQREVDFFFETFLLFSVLGRKELYVGGQTAYSTFTKQEWLLLLILSRAQLIVRPAIHLIAIILSAHILCDSHEWIDLWYLRGAPIPGFLRLRATHQLLLLLPLLISLKWYTEKSRACRSTMLSLTVLKVELNGFHPLLW